MVRNAAEDKIAEVIRTAEHDADLMRRKAEQDAADLRDENDLFVAGVRRGAEADAADLRGTTELEVEAARATKAKKTLPERRELLARRGFGGVLAFGLRGG
jgi:hypothetical protein